MLIWIPEKRGGWRFVGKNNKQSQPHHPHPNTEKLGPTVDSRLTTHEPRYYAQKYYPQYKEHNVHPNVGILGLASCVGVEQSCHKEKRRSKTYCTGEPHVLVFQLTLSVEALVQ